MARNHLMVDVETLSSRPDAALISIGAVWFDPWEDDLWVWDSPPDVYGFDPERTFSQNITFDSAIQYGHIKGETVAWWMGAKEDSPNQEARDALFTPEPKPLGQVLFEFGQWVGQTRVKDEDPLMWSHATFDPPVLTFAFEAVKKPMPWKFRAQRDMRTISWEAFGPHRMGGIPEDREHIAIWDAWREVFMAQKALQTIRYRGLHPEVTGLSLQRSPFGVDTKNANP